MKEKLSGNLIRVVVCATLVLCATVMAGIVFSNKQINSNASNNLPIDYLHGDYAIDVNNPREVVGFADYYFIARIDSVKDTFYRDPIKVETENGSRTVTSPYTNYEVTVVENIKGELPLETSIELTKAGGVSEDGTSIVLYENDVLLEAGKTYVIAAAVQPDGSLLVSGPRSNEEVKNTNLRNGETAVYSSNYAQEEPYDRERYTCSYE